MIKKAFRSLFFKCNTHKCIIYIYIRKHDDPGHNRIMLCLLRTVEKIRLIIYKFFGIQTNIFLIIC